MRRPLAALAAVALLGSIAACGDGDDDGPGEDEATHDEVGADSREAELVLLDGWRDVHPDAEGEAEVALEDDTTIELRVSGLDPDTEYPVHLHDAGCEADPPGGSHWQSDPDEDQEENHIHTYVITDAEGHGESTETSDLIADDRAMSIVVHAAASNPHLGQAGSDRIFCGDLEPR